MEASEETTALLREIKDIQKEHLAEYKAAAERSIELQQRAVTRAESIGRIYRVALAVSAVLIIGIILLIIYLMTLLPRR
jgi:hypothetical protein